MKPVYTDDKPLIRQCQQGETAAFEQLLGRHYDTLYRFAYQWCGNQENAQDITQLACMKLARNIRQYRFESSFTSWLYKLTINCAKDFYKSPNQHNVREEQHDDLDSQANPDNDLPNRRLYSQQILEHIGKLQEELRDTLILVYAHGLNHKEAAQHLDIKESTVSWRVHEARKILKKTFITSELGTSPASEGARGLA
jgi:RNA polymerase sigma-70 factor (ECF subfamily)